jgi:hypothetical protein
MQGRSVGMRVSNSRVNRMSCNCLRPAVRHGVDNCGIVIVPVDHHIQDRSKLGRLSQCSRSVSICRVKETRDPVREDRVLRMRAHVVQRHCCEDDARISYSSCCFSRVVYAYLFV